MLVKVKRITGIREAQYLKSSSGKETNCEGRFSELDLRRLYSCMQDNFDGNDRIIDWKKAVRHLYFFMTLMSADRASEMIKKVKCCHFKFKKRPVSTNYNFFFVKFHIEETF